MLTLIPMYAYNMYTGHSLGVSPEEQKLKINAEIDRLVDDGDISYHHIAEVCLTIQTTKNQLLSAGTGLYCVTS